MAFSSVPAAFAILVFLLHDTVNSSEIRSIHFASLVPKTVLGIESYLIFVELNDTRR